MLEGSLARQWCNEEIGGGRPNWLAQSWRCATGCAVANSGFQLCREAAESRVEQLVRVQEMLWRACQAAANDN